MELRAARQRSGKTQEQVAEEAKISVVAYQLYEYGKREPRARTAIRIARVLSNTVENLFGAETSDKAEQSGGNPVAQDDSAEINQLCRYCTTKRQK